MSTTKYPFDLQRALDGEPFFTEIGKECKIVRKPPGFGGRDNFWVRIGKVTVEATADVLYGANLHMRTPPPSVIRSDKSQEAVIPSRSQLAEAMAGAMAEFRRLLSIPKAESGYDLKARLDDLSANLKEI